MRDRETSYEVMKRQLRAAMTRKRKKKHGRRRKGNEEGMNFGFLCQDVVL